VEALGGFLVALVTIGMMFLGQAAMAGLDRLDIISSILLLIWKGFTLL
jgi:hypothetical protein